MRSQNTGPPYINKEKQYRPFNGHNTELNLGKDNSIHYTTVCLQKLEKYVFLTKNKLWMLTAEVIS